jgi:hypothetical protein
MLWAGKYGKYVARVEQLEKHSAVTYVTVVDL